MKGAALVRENRLTEIWLSAMLPHLKDPPTLDEFVGGGKSKREAVTACLQAWDKIDRALSGSKN